MRFVIGLVAGAGAGLVLALAPAEELADNPLTARVLAWSGAALDSLSEALEAAPVVPEAAAPVAPPVEPPAAPPVARVEADAAPAADTTAAEPAAQPILRAPDPPFDAAGPQQRAVAARQPGNASAPVWEPFRSEMSAVGFADRLTRSLDHPFLVERRGPGRYQVVFGYRDEAERTTLLQDAAAVTGLPL